MKIKKLLLDCNIWVRGLVLPNSSEARLLDKALEGEWVLIVNSYCVAETINVLQGLHKQKLESYFWNILSHPQVELSYTVPVTKALVRTLRKATHILLIAQVLDVEPKDVPYLLTAYEKKCFLVTEDIRSLWDKRVFIKDKTGIVIKTIDEIFSENRKY